MSIIKEQNRALCERYPFLIPSNRWSGKKITDGAGFWPGSPDAVPDWDFGYTELDEMPSGWRIAFGEQLCGDIKAELERAGTLDDYRITQIKEKYGSIRWYGNFCTQELNDIISKYENMSKRTCICCGKPATRITTGWISPYCDNCCPGRQSMPIDEFYSEVDMEGL